MLRTRLWMGALLIALAGVILFEDRWFAPWFPLLFVATAAACGFAVRELIGMLDPASRPSQLLCQCGVLGILIANWREPLGIQIDAWHLIGLIFVACGVLAFLIEMGRFHGPNQITERIAQ